MIDVYTVAFTGQIADPGRETVLAWQIQNQARGVPTGFPDLSQRRFTMKLDPKKLALSFGGATAILWTICSVFVAFVPGRMMSMTGHMLHADATGFAWTMTGVG